MSSDNLLIKAVEESSTILTVEIGVQYAGVPLVPSFWTPENDSREENYLLISEPIHCDKRKMFAVTRNNVYQKEYRHVRVLESSSELLNYETSFSSRDLQDDIFPINISFVDPMEQFDSQIYASHVSG